MKKKILTILISLLFLTMIPSVSGINSNSEDIEPCLDVGRVFFRGIVFFPHYSGDDLICFVPRILYIEFTPTEQTIGWIRLGWVRFENFTGTIIIGPFNIIGYLYGIFPGGLDIWY
jgi:hypothetical protein